MRRTKGVIREEQDDVIRAQALRQCLESLDGPEDQAPDKMRRDLASAVRQHFDVHPQIIEGLVGAASAGVIGGRLAAASKPLPGSVRRLGVVAARMMLCAFEAGYYNRSTYFSVRSFRALIHTEFFHADTELDRVEESANGQ